MGSAKIYVLFFLILLSTGVQVKADCPSVDIYTDYLDKGDTVTLKIIQPGDPAFGSTNTILKKTVSHGRVSFTLPSTEETYMISIVFPKKGRNKNGSRNLYGYFIFNDDHIVYRDHGKIQLNGTGASAWEAYGAFKSIENIFRERIVHSGGDSLLNNLNWMDSCFQAKMGVLNGYKKRISRKANKMLAIRALSVAAIRKSRLVRNSQADSSDITKVMMEYKSPIPELQRFLDPNEDVFSGLVAEGIIARFKLENGKRDNVPFSVRDFYWFLIENFSGLLRDKMIVYVLTKHREENQLIEKLIDNALTTVESSMAKQTLEKLRNSNNVGAKAFDFSLPDTSGKYINLSDFRGKKVLLDFWFTGCPPCKALTEKMKDLEPTMSDQGIVLISISTDKDKAKWKRSIRSGEYTTEQSINLHADYIKGKSLVLEYYSITGYPTLILIDSQGNLMRYPTNPTKDNGVDLLTLIDNP